MAVGGHINVIVDYDLEYTESLRSFRTLLYVLNITKLFLIYVTYLFFYTFSKIFGYLMH